MEAELLNADGEMDGHDEANSHFSKNRGKSLIIGVSEQAYKHHVYHGASLVGRPPGSATATTRQPVAEFTAGLKTELYEKAYDVQSYTHLSGDSRTLPASRKQGSVKEPKKVTDINFP